MVRLVVMAAGQASRMGQDKLGLSWKDSTVLGHGLGKSLAAIELAESLLPNRQETQFQLQVIARRPIETYAPEELIHRFRQRAGVWTVTPGPQPLAATIQMGLQSLDDRVKQIGFLPADQVGVTVDGLARLLSCSLTQCPDFLVPVAEERSGAPVFFHHKYFSELLTLKGERGGKFILGRYPHLWTTFPIEASFFADVDTPEDYDRLSKDG